MGHAENGELYHDKMIGMLERLWGDGREAEAKALIDSLDALNRALDRIRIGEIGRAATLH